VEKMYDVIISGAGPAGLSTGIFCARQGLSVVIFEKESKPSPLPRGETVHDHPVFTELLGDKFLENLALNKTAARKFNSPNSLQALEIQRKTSSIVFDWEKFIDRLVVKATEAGVIIKTNSEVIGLLEENNQAIGLKLANGEKILGHTVIVADGHQSKIGTQLGIPYNSYNCKMVKCLVSNFHGTYRGFEYFFLPTGVLDYAPRFPPSIVFIFPRENDKCEIGLMVLNHAAEKLGDACVVPTDQELLEVWHKIITTYPKLHETLKGITTDLEYTTAIPTAGMYSSAMPIPGLILIGDSFGFVEASGGSGISASLQAAKFVAHFLTTRASSPWNGADREQFNSIFAQTHIYKHIQKVYRLILMVQRLVFVKWRTPTKINKKWWLIKILYKFG
jgi:flavin-dependent dehydrogenase